jgi:hypothetical protein
MPTQFTSSAWNILFATTDSHYQPSWAVTTLFVPAEPSRMNSSALVSYQIPYDSVNIDTSPSFAIHNTPSDPLNKAMKDLESTLLSIGYFLNLPDYEGPLASFAAGVTSGHATIDSIRAALSFGKKNLGMARDTKSAMWGYSGGAFATEWAAELQVQYAPEIDFAGAILGGLTPNITSVLQTINKSLYSGLIPTAILGMTAQYPDIRAELEANLKPASKATFMSTLTKTLFETEFTFFYQDIFQYFVHGIADIMDSSVMKVMYRDGIMGYHGVPEMPMYIYQAKYDEISPIADTRKLIGDYCKMGADIEFYENFNNVHHLDEATNKTLNFLALEFLRQVFLGTHVPGNCGAPDL